MAGLILRHGLPRELRTATYLIGFVVATVATVLLTRGILALSGYPRLGGHKLHLAHVLWGGLVMAVGIILAISFVGPTIRPIAAIVGGIGFGLFLDEVGKFVTATTDYFFRPAVAIMYVVVVLLALVAQWAHGRRPPDPHEVLAAAVAEAVGGVAGGISDTHRARAVALVESAGPLPGSAETLALLRAVPPSRRQLGDPLDWARRQVTRVGRAVLYRRWLRVTTVVILIAGAAVGLIGAGAALAAAVVLAIGGARTGVTFRVADLALIPATLAALCIAYGAARLRRRPHDAYAWFQRGLLIDLLLTQPFIVAAEQFSALPTVAVDLIMLAVVTAARSAGPAPRTT